MVDLVLEQVTMGMDWDSIVAEWRGAVTKDAIAEAVRMARMAFTEHAKEYLVESLAS